MRALLAAAAALVALAVPAHATYLPAEYNVGTSGLVMLVDAPELEQSEIRFKPPSAACTFQVVASSDLEGTATVAVSASAFSLPTARSGETPVSTGVKCVLRDGVGAELFSVSGALPGTVATAADTGTVPFWLMTVCVSANFHRQNGTFAELPEHCVAPQASRLPGFAGTVR